jgi:hypothetical protein
MAELDPELLRSEARLFYQQHVDLATLIDSLPEIHDEDIHTLPGVEVDDYSLEHSYNPGEILWTSDREGDKPSHIYINKPLRLELSDFLLQHMRSVFIDGLYLKEGEHPRYPVEDYPEWFYRHSQPGAQYFFDSDGNFIKTIEIEHGGEDKDPKMSLGKVDDELRRRIGYERIARPISIGDIEMVGIALVRSHRLISKYL